MKILVAAAFVATSFAGLAITTTGASAAEPIVGTWRLADGRTIRYSGSGSRYCGKAVGGKHSGKSIGCMSGKGSNYKGTVKDLTNNKTYTGSVRVNGNSMSLKGCVARILCRTTRATRI